LNVDESATSPSTKRPVRAAYIHVPFCAHHCGYCNFTVVAGRDDLADAYLTAIGRELSALGQPRPVDTLYFGGGTPTHLSPAALDRLCEVVLRWHPLQPGYEWTVEANPADLGREKIDVLTRYGATRVSLGAQSFDAHKLRLLERDHAAVDIHRAVDLIRDAGMDVAIDLIFAVPGESLATWAADLHAAVRLSPNHVSTYGLTFERGTQFWNRLHHGQLGEVDAELQRAMYLLGVDRLTAAGFEHYEISNFAQPGRRSRHNETYWSGDGYYAAGPGAARYVDAVRSTNHRSTTTWLRRVMAGESPIAERDELSPPDRARELLVFALRRIEGVDRAEFHQRTGYTVDDLVPDALARYVRLGLLSDDGRRVRLTREGILVSDTMWPDFVNC